ncbi:MAG: GNAT family N-acetyltransferase, partial [Anaerolinea sp.]|nr:GNAT family N-acetyltransferase [Anaerolinea sp.]
MITSSRIVPLATGTNCAAVSAAHFSFDELAAIYNQTRVDYIVPMPMNGKRMEEYVRWYDVDLASSVVTINSDGDIAAIGMLGLRGARAWITRLGVIPRRRQHGLGQFTLETLLQAARRRGATAV